MPKILTPSMFADCPKIWDIVCRFETSPIGRSMQATVEDSPYHREENTWVHTEMAIAHYLKVYGPHRTERQNRLAVISLLWHDAGKPSAEEVVETAGSTYRRYGGHEQISAVFFTEFFLQDLPLQELITLDEARQIRWIIEHHVPFGFKDPQKRTALRTALAHTMREDEETFFDHVRSDAAGRISDDHQQKLRSTEDWFVEFKQLSLAVNRVDTNKGRAFIMIGPSGSGKSTWTTARVRPGDKVLSLDTARLAFLSTKNDIGFSRGDEKGFYRAAFEHACANEREFNAFVQQQTREAFHELRATGADVYIDNTNGSKKVRAKWIQEARAVGMKVIAVEFWNTLETLAQRQKTRSDKEVPYSSLKSQYFAQTSAWHGSEVDEVIVVHGS